MTTPVEETDELADTVDVLVKTLRALGQAGQPDTANRLAARAWWVLRQRRPCEAERINGAMHYLARLPEQALTPPTHKEEA